MKKANKIIAAMMSPALLISAFSAVYTDKSTPVFSTDSSRITVQLSEEIARNEKELYTVWIFLDDKDAPDFLTLASNKISPVTEEEMIVYYSMSEAEQTELLIKEKLDITEKYYEEKNNAAISSLGIDKECISYTSRYTASFICELTGAKIMEISENEIVETISLYDSESPTEQASVSGRITNLNNEMITSVSKHEPLEDTQDMTTMMEEASILPGDANCDYKLTVADAVAVLQYIANAEKYPLSPQGKVNADIDGVPGITGTDAIAIQCLDAGVEYAPKAQKKRTYSTKEELISLMVSEDEDFSEHGFIYAPGYKFDAVLNAGNDSTKDYLIIYGLDPEDCKLNEYRWGYMPGDIVINYTDFIYAAEPEFYSGSTYMPGALKEEYRITSESGNSLEVIFLIDRTAPGFMYEMTDERWTASYGFSYMPYVFPDGAGSK